MQSSERLCRLRLVASQSVCEAGRQSHLLSVLFNGEEMPKVEKHIHKLKRLKFKSGNAMYFCILPDCMFKINCQLALGKRSLCHRCEEPFIMNEYTIRLAKPHCDRCHKPKNENQVHISIPPEILTTHITESSKLSLADRLTKVIQARHAEDDGEI